MDGGLCVLLVVRWLFSRLYRLLGWLVLGVCDSWLVLWWVSWMCLNYWGLWMYFIFVKCWVVGFFCWLVCWCWFGIGLYWGIVVLFWWCGRNVVMRSICCWVVVDRMWGMWDWDWLWLWVFGCCWCGLIGWNWGCIGRLLFCCFCVWLWVWLVWWCFISLNCVCFVVVIVLCCVLVCVCVGVFIVLFVWLVCMWLVLLLFGNSFVCCWIIFWWIWLVWCWGWWLLVGW